MTLSSSRVRSLAAGGLLALALISAPAAAQDRPALERRTPAPAAAPPRIDASATREDLMELLQKHPPAIARVFKLDPSLMRSESYLASYPELREFLAQHPEIPQNSQYYLEGIRISPGDGYQRDERLQLAAGILA